MKCVIPLLLLCSSLFGQDHLVPLWPDGIPNLKSSELKEHERNEDILWITKVEAPTIEVYLPSRRHATKQAVIICPGGGYMGLAYDWEGTDIAQWLSAQGVAGIVLKYRLPSPITNHIPHMAPLQDAQQALLLIRKHAGKWNIDPQKIGIMGFSAGGHLASTVGTHFEDPSLRPDFMVLVYPVISMDATITHSGSRKALLGERPKQELINKYSNEKRVTKETPPTFMVHSADDQAVSIANSLRFQQALLDHKVPIEFHAYPYGGHGYSTAIGQGRLAQWPLLFLNWLKELD